MRREYVARNPKILPTPRETGARLDDREEPGSTVVEPAEFDRARPQ